MLASLSVRHGKRRAQIGVTFVKQIDTEGASLDQGRYIVALRLMPTAREGGSIDSDMSAVAVIPYRRPSWLVVMIATPEASRRMAPLNAAVN
jgi:hypothetical protein